MKIRKNSLSAAILLALEKAIDGYVRFEDFAYHHYRYHHGIPELKKSALSAALKRLREAGYIEKRINEGQVILKLTVLGQEALGPKFDESKWDGKWRMVIFDIPEDKRGIRDLFRRRLKSWGFQNWQQSVWITRNNITDKLRKLIDELEIQSWVAVIESDDPAFNNITFNGRGT